MNIGEAKCIFHRLTTSYRRQSKTLILLTRVDKKSLETEFSIVICRQTGDKWQSKTLLLSIFLSVFVNNVKSDFDCGLSRVLTVITLVNVCLKNYRIRSFLSLWLALGDLCKHLGKDSSTDLPDRYSNLFLNAYINRHSHTEYLKMI